LSLAFCSAFCLNLGSFICFALTIIFLSNFIYNCRILKAKEAKELK